MTVRREESSAPRSLDEAVSAFGGAGLHRIDLSAQGAVIGRLERPERASKATSALTAQWSAALRLAQAER
ncbi:MAG: hypothetical protein KDB18_03220, partial [Salinibacterium sp.]|nr:hypothetical protein [Salinibacterium sp.]